MTTPYTPAPRTARRARVGTLVVVGVNHHTAPLAVRERLALDPAAWYGGPGRGLPALLLATCNRVEVYAWSHAGRARATGRLVAALADAAGVPLDELRPHLSCHTGTAGLAHLVRVVAGLDSLVVGEEEIVGQVREAYRLARAHDTLPGALEGVLARALQAGRRIRASRNLGPHPSLADAAVAVALRAPERQATGRAVVLGAGVVAARAARALHAAGLPVVVCNRTLSHAAALAASLGPGVEAAPLDDLPRLLRGGDAAAPLLVCATASRRPVVDGATLQAAQQAHPGRSLLVLDLAVPRDVDPAARHVPGVRLLDLDDLERLCPVDVRSRHLEVAAAEREAAREAEGIAAWLRARAAAPSIVALRSQAEALRADELRRSARHLRDLSPEQHAAVERMTRALVDKLLHGPTVALREAALGGRGQRAERVLDVLRLDRRRARPGNGAPLW